jgi:proline iminopeptidase
MPYATTPDNVKPYYEEVGQGTPILFIHEFAGDHRSWERARVRQALPLRRLQRARIHAVSYPVRPKAYSYMHVMRDAVAMLDHLKIDRAHLVGLSMGGYTALQVALNHPQRVRSLVLAGAGSGSERWYTEDFHKRSRDLAAQFEREGSAAVAQTYGRGPSRLQLELKDPRGFAEFSTQLSEHDPQGSAHMSRGFQGERPSLHDFERDIRRLTTPALIVVGDEDERCIEPGLFLKDAIPASGLMIFPKTDHAVNLEEPDLFNQVIDDFLSRVDGGGWLPRDPPTRPPSRRRIVKFAEI